MVPPDGLVAAAGDARSVIPPYLVELIQTTVRDEVEEMAERLHGDVVRMHVDMLVQVDSVRVRTIMESAHDFLCLSVLLLVFKNGFYYSYGSCFSTVCLLAGMLKHDGQFLINFLEWVDVYEQLYFGCNLTDGN